MMEIALLIFAVANLLLVGSGVVGAAAIALVLFGLSKVIYDPTIHAYVGDTVPYSRRGRAVGFVELSWSSAWLHPTAESMQGECRQSKSAKGSSWSSNRNRDQEMHCSSV